MIPSPTAKELESSGFQALSRNGKPVVLTLRLDGPALTLNGITAVLSRLDRAIVDRLLQSGGIEFPRGTRAMQNDRRFQSGVVRRGYCAFVVDVRAGSLELDIVIALAHFLAHEEQRLLDWLVSDLGTSVKGYFVWKSLDWAMRKARNQGHA